MPSGKTHTMATATIVLAEIIVSKWFPVPETLFVVAGSLSTLIMNPDLDLNYRIQWHKLHKALWQLFWYPYSRLFAHRGLSHFPVIGTLTRVVYIGIIPYLVMRTPHIPRELYFIIGGMCISDVLHWAMDKTSTAIKEL